MATTANWRKYYSRDRNAIAMNSISPTSRSALPENASKPLSGWLLLFLVGIALPLLTNALLPFWGVDGLANLLTPENVCVLGFLGVAAAIYWAYFQFVVSRPIYLVVYSMVFMQIAFFLAALLDSTGRHVPIRAIHVPVLVLPAVYLLIRNFSKLWANYSYFRWILLFLGIYSLYYLLFNYNFVDPTVAKTTGISISKGNLTDYLYGFVILILTACTFIRTKTVEQRTDLFDRINKILIISALIGAVSVLACYPTGLLTMKVEGFRRAVGFLPHPNEYGKMEGFLLIYFIGLYYHYARQALVKTRGLPGLLLVTIALNLLSFVLSLSKNAFVGFGLACAIYLVFALLDPKLRGKMLVQLSVLAGLIAIALLGYQAASGKDMLTLLTDRFNDTRSLDWRTRVWGYLVSNIDAHSLWWGHGLTASNMEMYRFQYKNSMASDLQSIYVHNAVIQFLYDMGLWGLLIYGGIVSAVTTAFERLFKGSASPLYLMILGLSVFLVAGSVSDECITDLYTNIMYWFMLTMIFSVLESRKANEYQ
jgi:hypothetical protein